MKLQSKYIVLTLSVLTVFIFSCMEPLFRDKREKFRLSNSK